MRRTRLLLQSLRRCGLRHTFLAVQAKRHGAIQKLVELAGLSQLVAENPPRIVVEIGTDRGGTYHLWSKLATRDATLVSIDLDEKHLRTRPWQEVVAVTGDSHDPDIIRSLGHLKGRVDLLFIDGDHSYQGVRADFENYAPLVKPGGLIVFHDIVAHDDPTCHVNQLWTELQRRYDTLELIDTADIAHGSWAGIGVIRNHGDRFAEICPETRHDPEPIHREG